MSHLTITETVYSDRDNTVELAFQLDGSTIDHTTLTRMQLERRGGVIMVDSNDSPAAFDFTNAGKVILKLGSLGLPKGRHQVMLVVYDALNPNGLEWTEIWLEVR